MKLVFVKITMTNGNFNLSKLLLRFTRLTLGVFVNAVWFHFEVKSYQNCKIKKTCGLI